MKIIKNKTVEQSKTTYICDVCKNEGEWSLPKCIICEKDLCGLCRIDVDLYDNLDTPSFSDDYSDVICRSCWEKGKDIRKIIMDSRDEQEKEEERLISYWKEIVK